MNVYGTKLGENRTKSISDDGEGIFQKENKAVDMQRWDHDSYAVYEKRKSGSYSNSKKVESVCLQALDEMIVEIGGVPEIGGLHLEAEKRPETPDQAESPRFEETETSYESQDQTEISKDALVQESLEKARQMIPSEECSERISSGDNISRETTQSLAPRNDLLAAEEDYGKTEEDVFGTDGEEVPKVPPIRIKIQSHEAATSSSSFSRDLFPAQAVLQLIPKLVQDYCVASVKGKDGEAVDFARLLAQPVPPQVKRKTSPKKRARSTTPKKIEASVGKFCQGCFEELVEWGEFLPKPVLLCNACAEPVQQFMEDPHNFLHWKCEKQPFPCQYCWVCHFWRCVEVAKKVILKRKRSSYLGSESGESEQSSVPKEGKKHEGEPKIRYCSRENLFTVDKPFRFRLSSLPISEKIHYYNEEAKNYEDEIPVIERVEAKAKKTPGKRGRPKRVSETTPGKEERAVKLKKSASEPHHVTSPLMLNSALKSSNCRVSEKIAEKIKPKKISFSDPLVADPVHQCPIVRVDNIAARIGPSGK